MRKLRLSALLLASLICTGCNFYEAEGESSSVSEEEASLVASSQDIQYSRNWDCEGCPQVVGKFTTKGLDGNTYDESLFEGKLTLLNMWGTYCGPCVSEMPGLATLHNKYYEADFQVVGILVDITDSNYQVNASQKAKADQIVKNAKVTYPSLLPCDGLKDFINSTEYIPYSVFIDEHGHQLGDAIVGSKSSSEWQKLIKSMMQTYL